MVKLQALPGTTIDTTALEPCATRLARAGIRRSLSSSAALGVASECPSASSSQPVPTPTWFAECAAGRDDLAVATLPLYGRKSEVCAVEELIAFEGLWAGVEPAEGRCARPRHA